MAKTLGIIRETKSKWEGRIPLVPEDFQPLLAQGINILAQPSSVRAFADEELRAAGAVIGEDLSSADVIFGVKEIKPERFLPGKTYLFFSHVIKGQAYNMPMLKRMMELGCNLLDYEVITDSKGRRLIAFGRFAGIAAMVDTLWAFGRRLTAQSIASPFARLKKLVDYPAKPADAEQERFPKLALIKREFAHLAQDIRANGLPAAIVPMVVGITGYGSASGGVQEMLDILPVETIPAGDLEGFMANGRFSAHKIYKVVFKEADMVVPRQGNFDLQDYYHNPQRYQGVMYRYLPHLKVLMNCIYWTKDYPRVLTMESARKLYEANPDNPLTIGDVSCDLRGAIEPTVQTTEPDNPVYVYDLKQKTARFGFDGHGPLILAVDFLPSEMPCDASGYFSHILRDFVPDILSADFSKPVDATGLPDHLHRALILHQGKLTAPFTYIEKYL